MGGSGKRVEQKLLHLLALPIQHRPLPVETSALSGDTCIAHPS